MNNDNYTCNYCNNSLSDYVANNKAHYSNSTFLAYNSHSCICESCHVQNKSDRNKDGYLSRYGTRKKVYNSNGIGWYSHRPKSMEQWQAIRQQVENTHYAMIERIEKIFVSIGNMKQWELGRYQWDDSTPEISTCSYLWAVRGMGLGKVAIIEADWTLRLEPVAVSEVFGSFQMNIEQTGNSCMVDWTFSDKLFALPTNHLGKALEKKGYDLVNQDGQVLISKALNQPINEEELQLKLDKTGPITQYLELL